MDRETINIIPREIISCTMLQHGGPFYFESVFISFRLFGVNDTAKGSWVLPLDCGLVTGSVVDRCQSKTLHSNNRNILGVNISHDVFCYFFPVSFRTYILNFIFGYDLPLITS